MPIARSLDAYRQSDGNLAVLVLIDSTQPEVGLSFESVFGALTHFGIPFRVVDLGAADLSREPLDRCRAAVVVQEHLGSRLGEPGQAALLGAVEQGMGLVNFDSDLSGYERTFHRALGVTGAGATGDVVVGGTDRLHVRRTEHPITWWQDGDLTKMLKRPVPTARVRVTDATVLLEDAEEAPALIARRLGRGKVVQWLASPKLWLRQYFGHTFGLDDVWLRSITWAARKPFVMKAMPPFVRLRFDDCRGLWRDAGDLRFLEVLNERGHVPSACFCLRALTPDGSRKVATLFHEGKAEFAPHTLAPNTSLYYGDAGGEYSRERFVDIFREIDETLARLGIRPSRILSDHDHGWSSNAIPGLVARGITYKMNITMPGEAWEEPHQDWQPAPYGSMDYAFDYLPRPAEAFFAVYNHYPPAFEAARAYLDDGRFLYHRTGGYGQYMWDMLNGLTRGPAHTENQIDAIAQRLADHTRLGLDAMFFGGSITHSHFIQHVPDDAWREIIRRADARLPRHRYEPAPYDLIADYARSKVETTIVRADATADVVTVELDGEAVVPLRLYVITAEEGDEHRFETTAPFKGRVTMQFRP